MPEQRTDVVEFDICGQICPSALLTALREVNQNKKTLQRGILKLVFLTDNRDATSTIPGAVTNMGYEVKVTKDQGCYRIEISKN